MNRREILKLMSITSFSLLINKKNLFSFSLNPEFEKVIKYLNQKQKSKNNIPILTGDIGYYFIGTPYKAGTLENDYGIEKCSVTLTGFDCVTFFETSLDLARIFFKGKHTFESLINEVEFTRYRNGKNTGYTSRLHYMSDWIYDNIKKKVVKDITEELGGIKKQFNINFMSTHPQYYPMLEGNTKLINVMKKIENNISERNYYIIPYHKIKSIENNLQTGDIIALTTKVSGLDYSHTGIIYRKNDKSHFLHASTDYKQVTLDSTISEYVKRIGKKQSITVVRPLNVI